MKRKNVFWFLLTVTLILNAFLIGTVRTSPETKVYVDPETTVKNPGESFAIYINISDATTGVNYWEFKLGYDQGILSTSEDKIYEGDFLSQDEANPTFFTKTIGPGYIMVGCMITDPTGVTGSGDLAYITFTVVDKGRTSLDLYDTKVRDTGGMPIDHIIQDGEFYTEYPRADFYYKPSPVKEPDYRNPIVGETVTFNATYDPKTGEGSYDSDGTITTYTWDFGDGSPVAVESDPIATHAYASSGSYPVILTVTDDSLPPLTDTATESVTVELHDIAIAQVQVTPTTIRPGQTAQINVTVENQGSASEYFNVTAYYDNTPIWYNKTLNLKAYSQFLAQDPETGVPVGRLLEGESISVIFNWNTTGVEDGTYTIRVNASITDETGTTFLLLETDTADNEKTVPNILLTSVAPVADFTFTPEHPRVGETVTFDASASNAPAGIVAYTWDFGDGTPIITKPSTESIATHVYTSVGTYSVTLNVTDSLGLNGTVIKFITASVHDISVIAVSALPTTVNIGGFASISVTVKNEGGFRETFNITTRYDGNTIETRTDITLLAGRTETLTFSWNTTGSSMGTYTITAEASAVLLEVNTTNNVKTAVYPVTLTAHDVSIESIGVTPTTVKIGESITISVTVKNEGSFNETKLNVVTYYDENVIENRTDISLNTGNTTTLTFTWYTTGVAAGTYAVKAVAGVPDETDTADNIKIYDAVTLEKVTSTISTQASPSSVTVGESVSINGSITPARAGVTVTLWFRVKGTPTWNTLTTVTTNENGQYSHTWEPSKPETYEVKASQPEDAFALGSESNVETVTVQAVSNTLLYALAGVIIVILAAIILYFVKFRKPT